MFAGLSAFPLTPMDERGIDEAAFVRLVARLAETGVDSIGALGSMLAVATPPPFTSQMSR